MEPVAAPAARSVADAGLWDSKDSAQRSNLNENVVRQQNSDATKDTGGRQGVLYDTFAAELEPVVRQRIFSADLLALSSSHMHKAGLDAARSPISQVRYVPAIDFVFSPSQLEAGLNRATKMQHRASERPTLDEEVSAPSLVCTR